MPTRLPLLAILLAGMTACAPAVAPPAQVTDGRDRREAGPARTGAESELQITDYASTPQRREMFVIEINDAGRTRTLPADALALREFPRPTTPLYATRSEGTLAVTVALIRAGREVGRQSVSLPLQRDWIWGIALYLKAGDPTEGCFGCMGYVSAPLPPDQQRTPGEMFHIGWSGNSISSPAIF